MCQYDYRQIIFLKSWNEWGEGNYMEPDLKFGKGYIKALRNELDRFEANKSKIQNYERGESNNME